jgi:YHYH protein
MSKISNKRSKILPGFAGTALLAGFLACSNAITTKSAPVPEAIPSPGVGDVVPGSGVPIVQGSPVPVWLRSAYKSAVTITFDGTNYKMSSDSLPDYKSFYFGTGNPLYAALPFGKKGNPNKIQAQGYQFTIPATPKLVDGGKETGLGAIGVAVNGVGIFNNQAAPGDTLSSEIITFDEGNGHPTPNGAYHYHMEPPTISSNDGKLVGFLRDGFPVYGRKEENGVEPLYSDKCTIATAMTVKFCRPIPQRLPNFHCHATNLFPNGTCHYHVLNSDPYITGWYAGEPGALGGGIAGAPPGGGGAAAGGQGVALPNGQGNGQIPAGCPKPGDPKPAIEPPANCPRPPM